MNDYNQKYKLWQQKVTDEDVKQSLSAMTQEDIKNAFSSELSFGTGGLRGIMSAGTDRMNVYTVHRTTVGLAKYMQKHRFNSCAVTFDSRLNSERFSQITAATLAQYGITVYLTKECMPTPFLSFMVRYLHCDLGVNITASHNPSCYNGYKVYDSNGCQLTDNAANEVTSYIDKVDMFETPLPSFNGSDGKINYIDGSVEQAYKQSVLQQNLGNADGLKIVYTPLNGAGHRIVPDVLKTLGVAELNIVPEQSYPDGNFETCPYPNPEKAEALTLAIKLAVEKRADIVIATDPDSDRLGVAVNNGGNVVQLTGNEVGVLLTDYVLNKRKQQGTLPECPVVVKTIVTTKMVDSVAKEYGAEVIDVLTGFKYIGDVIDKLEQKGEQERFVFGFEESCGYLKGTYVRDKDGVVAAALVAECAAYYKRQGKTLTDRINELYAKYGNYLLETTSYRFDGADGAEVKRKLLDNLRSNPLSSVAGVKVMSYCDYLTQTVYDLPKANVMRFSCADGSQLIVRPSGTEPLIKCYVTVVGDKQNNIKRIAEIKAQLADMFAQ